MLVYNRCKYNLRMDFKQFVGDKIAYLTAHFKRKAVLLQQNGDTLYEINLSFDTLTDQFMAKSEEMSSPEVMMQNSTAKFSQLQGGLIKITDEDLKPLWEHLDGSYKLALNLEGQNITDDTVLRISQLYKLGRCGFTELKFSGNTKISQVGAVELANSLRDNHNIQKLKFHEITLGKHGVNRISELIVCTGIRDLDLGLIGNQSLAYLAKVLESPHKINTLSFGEDLTDPWKSSKEAFQQVIRRGEQSKQIFAINLYPEQTINHWQMMSELNILCRKKRNIKVTQRQNEFKFASLNPDHAKFYDPENHSQNAYKFSVKSYLTNVFGSDLDEALYFLEKERRNSIREQAIFKITKQPINKIIMEDICTSDGSIIVLAKYLLGKIKEKDQTKQDN